MRQRLFVGVWGWCTSGSAVLPHHQAEVGRWALESPSPSAEHHDCKPVLHVGSCPQQNRGQSPPGGVTRPSHEPPWVDLAAAELRLSNPVSVLFFTTMRCFKPPSLPPRQPSTPLPCCRARSCYLLVRWARALDPRLLLISKVLKKTLSWEPRAGCRWG